MLDGSLLIHDNRTEDDVARQRNAELERWVEDAAWVQRLP